MSELVLAGGAEVAPMEVDGARHGPSDADEDVGLKRLRLRNYVPNDPGLRDHQFESDPIREASKLRKQLLERFDDLSKTGNAPLSLAPKKANWDLKRDVARKLEKLEKRTNIAIVELVTQRQLVEAQQLQGPASSTSAASALD